MGGTGSAPPPPPQVKPGPMLDVRWRRETGTGGCGPGGVRGRVGGAGQDEPPQGIVRLPWRDPNTRWGAGYSCCFRHIPRQLCPSTQAGGEHSSAQHHTHCAREYTGIAWHQHRVATAPALHQHAWALHRHRMATALTLPTACMGTALAPYGNCTSTIRPLHQHYTSIHGHCTGTAQLLHGH